MKGLLLMLFAVFVAFVYSQAPSVNCPPYDDTRKEPVFIRHPCNCSTYFVCYPPNPIAMPCPPGLQFNEAKRQCDWPWIVRCTPDPRC